MFIPGETISHQFHLPFLKTDIIKVIATYRQNGHIVFEPKTIYPNQISNEELGSQFVITLSQEESLLFEDDKYFYVQLNVMFTSDEGNIRTTSMELRGKNELQHLREVVT